MDDHKHVIQGTNFRRSSDARSRILRRLDWNLLKTFSEIVRAGGISRAAEAMARQQPAVSAALRRLEDQVGAVLCHRGRGGFRLTDEGQYLADLCSQVEGLVASVPEDIDRIRDGYRINFRLVTVSNVVSLHLDAAICEFMRIWPHSRVLIDVATCHEIPSMVFEQSADIGVTPAERRIEQLEYKVLYREQHVIVCGSPHPLYGQTFDDPAQLAAERFVLPGTDEAGPVYRYREAHGLGRTFVGESLDLSEVRRMVLAGVGIALLPREFLAEDLDAGRIWPLMDPSPELQDDIYLITNPGSPHNEVSSKFVSLISAQ